MATIENYKGEQFEIETYFTQQFKGRGGWNINCEVSFKGEKKTFRHYTTDSMFIEKIHDMKADDASWDEIQNAYKEKAFDNLEESILEWCDEINEKVALQNIAEKEYNEDAYAEDPTGDSYNYDGFV